MGYANPIEAMGAAAFVDRAAVAGVDGVLVRPLPARGGDRVPVPPRPAASHRSSCCRQRRPPSGSPRSAASPAAAGLHDVSLKGVTGAGHIDTAEVARRLAEIRRHIDLPVGVGFGIRDAASAQAIAATADAVVIGSRIIQEIEAGPAETAAERAGAWLAGIAGDRRRRQAGGLTAAARAGCERARATKGDRR